MKALLVIDVQNDFCEHGTLAVSGANKIIPAINKIIDYFKKNNLLIVATKDWHPENHKSFAINSSGVVGELGFLNGLAQIWWPPHCIQDTNGSEFHPELIPIENVIYKGNIPEIDSYSGFFDNGKLNQTELFEFLKENAVNELFVVGIATDYCVKYTVLDALDLGFSVSVISNCCVGVNLSPDDSEKAILEMKNRGAKIIEWK